MKKNNLNKSRFVMGRQCPKALYLATQFPDIQPALTALEHKTLTTGNAVGEAARHTIPNGVRINSLNTNEALCETQKAIAAGVLTLYEPAFLYDDVLVRVDILSRDTPDSPWDFYEVKATTYHNCDKEQKQEYRNDIGIQVWVLQKLGIPLGRISLMHLNRECRYPDLNDLFSFEDYSAKIIPTLSDIEDNIAALKMVLKHPMAPSVPIGKQCNKPRNCPFKASCWKHIPKPSIFDVPRNLQKWKQYEQGTVSICNLNLSDFKSKTQQRALQCYQEQQSFFDQNTVAKLLDQWKYPLTYLDFEAIDYAIPRFSGARPYQHIPFQFSCHIRRSPNSELEHTEFLWASESDPRPIFIRELLSKVPKKGSIVAYHASYESTRLKDLAEDYSVFREELLDIKNRLVDLEVVITKGVYYPDFMGSFSIKKVAPALLGDVASYAGLDISDGIEAMLAFDRMTSLPDTSDEKQALRRNLLKYCKQDTMLMVQLHQFLLNHRRDYLLTS